MARATLPWPGFEAPDVVDSSREARLDLEREPRHPRAAVLRGVFDQAVFRAPVVAGVANASKACISRPAFTALLRGGGVEVHLGGLGLLLARRRRSLHLLPPPALERARSHWLLRMVEEGGGRLLAAPIQRLWIQGVLWLGRRRDVAGPDGRPRAIVRGGPVARQAVLDAKDSLHRGEAFNATW